MILQPETIHGISVIRFALPKKHIRKSIINYLVPWKIRCMYHSNGLVACVPNMSFCRMFFIWILSFFFFFTHFAYNIGREMYPSHERYMGCAKQKVFRTSPNQRCCDAHNILYSLQASLILRICVVLARCLANFYFAI